jgi:hypothetical protein
MLLSALLAVYAPMVMFSSHAAAEDAAMQTLKQKAIAEIDRRISSFEKTLSSMAKTVTVTPGNKNVNIASNDGVGSSARTSSSSPSVSPSATPGVITDGINAVLNFPKTLKDQSKQFLQKIVDELTQLKTKVQDAATPANLQALVQNLDSQLGLGQLGQVQSIVAQSVQSLTGVFSNLQTTAKNLQSQISHASTCIKDATNGENPSDCQLHIDSQELITQAQSQLANIGTMLTTVASVLLSSIGILASLLSQFASMAGGLGSLGSLGNIGNLSNMLDPSQLSSLAGLGGAAGGLGSITGLLSSFTGMASQLGIAGGMGSNIQGLLGSLTSFVNL